MFSALADPTRRNILEVIAKNGQLSAGDISSKFGRITPPAVSQHLKVLVATNLVQVEKRAQQRIYQINPDKVDELEKWLKRLKKSWEERFERLDAILEKEKRKLRK